jgi:imidazolonepropionase-like amidohydrolase
MPSEQALRRWHRWLVAAILGFVIPLLGAPSLGIAEKPNEPPFFAIQNARIVTGTGQVIESGTIVLVKGLISEVGARVTIPPEAWVIDGAGLTVYPGLIDALGDLGLKAGGPTGNGAGRGAGPPSGGMRQRRPAAKGPEDRPATTSWKCAADELKTEDKRLESWRSAGFTSAVTVPSEGILPGQAAIINLAGERPRDMVIQTPVALKATLDPAGGFRSFPGSLFGVMAYIKQVFADADHYETHWRIYEANPSGIARPHYDRSLEPLVRAKSEGWPVLIPGQWSKEIKRAIKLGEEIGVQTVVYGGHQGYDALDVLKEKKIPVLVSLEWPEASKDADPEAEESLRVLRFRDKAPSTPAAFQKAGVKFAFYSDGLKNPKDILENARKAIEAGLSKDDALKALTQNTADIFGVGDRMGSLSKGKIANLMVTDGDVFNGETKVKMVFIDGRKYTVRESDMPERPMPGRGSN